MGNPFAMHLAQNECQVEKRRRRGKGWQREMENVRELATTCDYRHLTWAEAGTARHRHVGRGVRGGGEASSNANLMQQCSRAEQQKERKEQMEQAKQPKRKNQGRQEDEESRSRSQRASSLPRHCSGKVSSGPSAKYIFDNCEYLSSLHPVQGQVKRVD